MTNQENPNKVYVKIPIDSLEFKENYWKEGLNDLKKAQGNTNNSIKGLENTFKSFNHRFIEEIAALNNITNMAIYNYLGHKLPAPYFHKAYKKFVGKEIRKNQFLYSEFESYFWDKDIINGDIPEFESERTRFLEPFLEKNEEENRRKIPELRKIKKEVVKKLPRYLENYVGGFVE